MKFLTVYGLGVWLTFFGLTGYNFNKEKYRQHTNKQYAIIILLWPIALPAYLGKRIADSE